MINHKIPEPSVDAPVLCVTSMSDCCGIALISLTFPYYCNKNSWRDAHQKVWVSSPEDIDSFMVQGYYRSHPENNAIDGKYGALVTLVVDDKSPEAFQNMSSREIKSRWGLKEIFKLKDRRIFMGPSPQVRNEAKKTKTKSKIKTKTAEIIYPVKKS